MWEDIFWGHAVVLWVPINNCNNKINTTNFHTRAFSTTAILYLSEGAWSIRKPARKKELLSAVFYCAYFNEACTLAFLEHVLICFRLVYVTTENITSAVDFIMLSSRVITRLGSSPCPVSVICDANIHCLWETPLCHSQPGAKSVSSLSYFANVKQ